MTASERAPSGQALAVPATPLRVDGPSGFDPSRMDAAWLVKLISDYGGGYRVGTFCDLKTFHARYPEIVSVRDEHKSRGDSPSEAMVAALIDFADAIAIAANKGGGGNG